MWQQLDTKAITALEKAKAEGKQIVMLSQTLASPSSYALIEQLKEKNCEDIFVYCNSLSSVVDFDRLAIEHNIKIVTPMQMYRNLGLEYKYLAVMAANSHGLTGVENNLYVSNPRLRVLGLSMLELVKAIEEGNKPEQIVEDFNFKTLFNYFELTNVEAVVLGCTHFPYIKKELEKIIQKNKKTKNTKDTKK